MNATAIPIRPLLAAFATLAISANAQNTTPAAPPSPVVRESGEILTGTAGTPTGQRIAEPADALMTGIPKWWNGKRMFSGDLNPIFETRDRLDAKGIDLVSNYRGALFGILASQGGSRATWLDQIDLGATLKPDEMFDNKSLEGLLAFVNFRYRDNSPPNNPNTTVQADSMFNPTNWGSGTQVRLLAFGVQATSNDLFPIEDLLTLRAGWIQPQREFIDQPLSKIFQNNAINSNKGIGGSIPFGSSFTTWGGTLNIAAHSFYLKNGIFMSYPNPGATANHGFAFSGNSADPSLNGLFYMGEAGWKPEFGEDALPGRYAFGSYFYGAPGGLTTTWSGDTIAGLYGFYFQADQMLLREPSTGTQRSSEGLSAFNLLTFCPSKVEQNTFPFYFQSGLAYTGPLPSRDKDIIAAAIGYGLYSEQGTGNPGPNYTAVIEICYRVQLGGWTYIEPYFQYIVRPDGTSDVANAAILGFETGVVF